jgi:hypothetical protein
VKALRPVTDPSSSLAVTRTPGATFCRRQFPSSTPPVPNWWSRCAAGPAHLRNLVSNFAVIPAQKSRDLRYREAAHKHVAQLGQLLSNALRNVGADRQAGPLGQRVTPRDVGLFSANPSSPKF